MFWRFYPEIILKHLLPEFHPYKNKSSLFLLSK